MAQDIQYVANLTDEVFPLQLEVPPSGVATLKLGTNMGPDEARAPGVYGGSVAAEELGALRAAVAAPEFAALELPPIVVGAPFRLITVKGADGGTVVSKRAGSDVPMPPPFAAADAVASRIVKGLFEKPQHAVRVQLTSVAASGIPRALVVAVEILNAGALPLRLPAVGVAGTTLTLVATRTAPDDDRPGQHFMEIKPAAIASVEPKPGEGAPIEIPRGGKVVVRFKKRVPLDPGTHEVRVLLAVGLGSDRGEQVAYVTARSNPVELTVR